MPHINYAAYGLFYSGRKCNLTEAQTPTKFLEQTFFRFFRLHKTWRKKKEKMPFTCQRAISAKGEFIVPSP
jgi:ribosomal protein L32E